MSRKFVFRLYRLYYVSVANGINEHLHVFKKNEALYRYSNISLVLVNVAFSSR